MYVCRQRAALSIMLQRVINPTVCAYCYD
jgi:hypothetical protein